jgi:Uma2 family endonuclease
LAVEVADTSLRYDMGRKAVIYTANDVRELWTINAETLQTHNFTKPAHDGYQERQLIEPNEVLVPGFAPDMAVKLAELQLL